MGEASFCISASSSPLSISIFFILEEKIKKDFHYNRAQLQVHLSLQVFHTNPKNSFSLPKVEKNIPIVGKNLPQTRKNLPQLGETLPQVGETFPQVGKTLPQVGETLPQSGEIHTWKCNSLIINANFRPPFSSPKPTNPLSKPN